MSIDYSQILWSQVNYYSYTVASRKDFFSLNLDGTIKPLIRIDCRHEKHFDHSLKFGTIHGTVKIKGAEATVFEQDIYLGANIVLIPSQFAKIESFYLNQFKTDYGKYSITTYEPATQVIINPLTNEPVILGQESLDLLENLQQTYSQKIIDDLSKEITLKVSNELQVITNSLNTTINNTLIPLITAL